MADGARSTRGAATVVGLFVAMLVATILFAPDSNDRQGDARLSSRSAATQGARGLAETLGRLGWRVERRMTAYAGPRGVAPESLAVHAVLDPPNDLRAVEVSALLGRVRHGGALLVVARRGTALADSLGMPPSRQGGRLDVPNADTAGCPESRMRDGTIWWPDGVVRTLWLGRRATDSTGDGPLPLPAGGVDFLQAHSIGLQRATGVQTRTFPAARGIPLGRGRVVVVADPDLLRNDVLRVCRWGAGVVAVQMSEWLAHAPGAGRRIVFDEFHQEPTSEADPGRVVTHAMIATRGGRLVLQFGVASLVLLGALGARALVPEARPPLRRRSPLEHVDALAHAYARVGATRLVARRLMRGLRRRHGRGAWRASDRHGDAAFLSAVATRHPTLASDVTRLLDAADRTPDRRHPTDPRPLADAAAAIDRALTPRSSTP